MDGATFSGNQVKCTGCSFSFGGGLDSEIKTGTVTVTNSQFDGNVGWFGGGLSGYTTLSVTHSSFTNNQGGYGGGINTSTLSGDWLLFQDNDVTNFGGAVAASDITLAHSRFIHNSAQKGGAVYVYSILRPSSNLLFAENNAWNSGAAVYLKSGSTATLSNATIARSAQVDCPAIHLETGSTLTLRNSIVNNHIDAIYVDHAGLTEDYNFYFNNTSDFFFINATFNPGGHSIRTPPLGFVDPVAGNYHLRSTSSAIAKGHNDGLTNDLDGRLRLSGRNDIGAYQFWASVFVPAVRK